MILLRLRKPVHIDSHVKVRWAFSTSQTTTCCCTYQLYHASLNNKLEPQMDFTDGRRMVQRPGSYISYNRTAINPPQHGVHISTLTPAMRYGGPWYWYMYKHSPATLPNLIRTRCVKRKCSWPLPCQKTYMYIHLNQATLRVMLVATTASVSHPLNLHLFGCGGNQRHTDAKGSHGICPGLTVRQHL